MNAKSLIEKYLEKTRISARLAEESCKFMLGGDTHGNLYNPPYHITIDHDIGCHLFDVDGNYYLVRDESPAFLD